MNVFTPPSGNPVSAPVFHPSKFRPPPHLDGWLRACHVITIKKTSVIPPNISVIPSVEGDTRVITMKKTVIPANLSVIPCREACHTYRSCQYKCHVILSLVIMSVFFLRPVHRYIVPCFPHVCTGFPPSSQKFSLLTNCVCGLNQGTKQPFNL